MPTIRILIIKQDFRDVNVVEAVDDCDFHVIQQRSAAHIVAV